MRVVSTPARAVAFFISTFMLGSFMSLPMALEAAWRVCRYVSATSCTFRISAPV